MDTTRRAVDRAADKALVERIRSGDESAFGELYDRWVDRVHDLASRIVGRDEAPDVTQEAFLVAWRRLDTLEDPASFGGWLLRTTRNRALDVLERAQRTRATDSEGFDMIEQSGPSTADVPAGFRIEDGIGAIHDPQRALEREEAQELVWSSVAALGERDATVLDLNLRHGLTPAEVGEVVGANRNAANQMLHRARSRLGDSVRARVLWRGGAPRCDALAAVLQRHGIVDFDADAIRVTNAHADACEHCSERRRLRLAPAALLGAIPIAVIPDAVNAQVAAALVGDGVPVSGSIALDHPASGGHAGERSDAPATPESAQHSARPWQAVVAAVVAGVTVVAIAWFVLSGDDNGDDVATSAPLDTSIASTTPASTTTSSSVPDVSLPTTEQVSPPAPANAPPAGDEPAVQQPQGVAPVVSLAITPGSADSTWTVSTAARLVWSVTGGGRVEVSGPGLLTSTSRTGDVALCPTQSPGWSVCPFAPGAWTYTVRVFGPGDNVLVEESAVLTRP